MNHDNEFLHYQDDWYIIDYEPDYSEKNSPFAFVYYRGSNDAWDGYGGVVIYTRDSKLPDDILPRVRAAAEKVGFDFDKDFEVTDNTCRSQTEGERLLLKEKFLGREALLAEDALRAGVVRAQKAVVTEEKVVGQQATKIEKAVAEFEAEIAKDLRREIVEIEKEVEKDVKKLF